MVEPASGRARFLRDGDDEDESCFHLSGGNASSSGRHPSIRVRHPPPGVTGAVVVASCLVGAAPEPPLAPQLACHPNSVVWSANRNENGVSSGTFKA